MRKLRISSASTVGTLVVAAANVGGMSSMSAVNVYASPGSWSSAASLPEPRVFMFRQTHSVRYSVLTAGYWSRDRVRFCTILQPAPGTGPATVTQVQAFSRALTMGRSSPLQAAAEQVHLQVMDAQ